MGSADWMPRNLDKRVEILFPVEDENLKKEARHILDIQLADNVKAQVISVGIKSFDLKYASHQLTIPNATNTTNEIYKYACQVFDELWDGTPIRHIGVQTSHVKEADECVSQMELFDNNNYEKWEKVDKTMDELREKFGIDVVKRATFVESPIDHMSGGISREKRTVDYSKIDIE